MTYLRRALKYFLQITLIFVVIIGALMLTGFVSKDVAVAFQHGWRSIGYIFALFAVMSLAYPYFGYGKRTIRAQGEPAELWPGVERAMEQRGYVKSAELPDGSRKYRQKSGFNRAARCPSLGRQHHPPTRAGRLPGRRSGTGFVTRSNVH